jgi:hypothetical protein
VYEFIYKLLKEFKIEKKVEMLVTDGGKNLKKAASLLQKDLPQIIISTCTCHQLNALLKQFFQTTIEDVDQEFALEEDDEELIELVKHVLGDQFNETIKKCKNVCTYFSHSIKGSEILKKNIAHYTDKEYTKLIQSNSTRWNSTFHSLKRMLEIKEASSSYLCFD